ncbi:MAG: ferric-dicitrate binding protein FerR (iron transport regulator), partial [Paraglaciecola sp.]
MLGTAFNVRDLATETMNSVSVKEGKVSVEATKNQQKVILTANEKAIYNAVTNELIEEKDLNL